MNLSIKQTLFQNFNFNIIFFYVLGKITVICTHKNRIDKKIKHISFSYNVLLVLSKHAKIFLNY